MCRNADSAKLLLARFNPLPLLVLSLSLFSVPALAEPAARPSPAGGTAALDVPAATTDLEKNHPPGALNQHDLSSVLEVARTLSTEPRLVAPGMLSLLDHISLRLDELYAQSPRYFRVDDKRYELIVEKVGTRWLDGAVKHSGYVVFLTHEVFSGLGEELVLGFENGVEAVYTEEELQQRPALALALQAVYEDDANIALRDVQDDEVLLGEATVELGAFQPFVKREFEQPEDSFASGTDELAQGLGLAGGGTRAACVHQAAIQSCSAGTPVCSTGSPFFVTTGLLIKTDHEGLLKGSPEIELFPLNRFGPGISPSQGASTTMIFSGRTVTDSAGRSVFLPDVNTVNQWYNIGGLAIMPYSFGSQWIGTLVEQDDTVGVFKSNDTVVGTNMFTTPSDRTIVSVDLKNTNFLKTIANLIKSAVFGGDGDDTYLEPIGVGNPLACATRTRTAANPFVLDSSQWQLRGYYACINPSCVPLDVGISGPSLVPQYGSGSWIASASGGRAPYSYVWKRNGVQVGTGSSLVLTYITSPFTLSVTVTDADGTQDTRSMAVNVEQCTGCQEP